MKRLLLQFAVPLMAAIFAVCTPVNAETLSALDGQKVIYDIKKFALTVGQATFEYGGYTELKGRDVYKLNFTAKAPNFYDEEQIFMDVETLYPVQVIRDLNIWGSKEKITEEYLHNQGIVRVHKTVGEKTELIELKKDERIDNIYCFITRLRLKGMIDPQKNYDMHLPTKDVIMKYGKGTKLRAAGNTYDAHYMKSDPAQFEVWFSSDSDLIPLRIDGGVGLVSSSMVMSEFQER